MQPQPQTLAQKLIARAAGKPFVKEGEILQCAIDLAAFHDSSGPRRLQPMLDKLGAQIWDKSKVVLVMDHFVPARDPISEQILQLSRDWARREDLPHVYDSVGIIHAVLPEQGHILPGAFCVGGDSHSCTGGALGAYMFGIGSTEMLGAIIRGQIWVKVPHTVRMHWSGALSEGLSAKDMMLYMIGRFGTNGCRYGAAEYTGTAVQALSMQERMTLANMSAELGAQVGLVSPDERTLEYLQARGAAQDIQVDDLRHWVSDEGALAEEHVFDASELKPMVAAPYSPSQAAAVDDYEDIAIQVAYIGACTGAKFDDIAAAAQVLKNKKINKNTKLLLAPASQVDLTRAREAGYLDTLVDAGAELLPTSCGACAGYGNALDDAGNVISTTARNFKGRMGNDNTYVYLASPYSVAAAAVAGKIVDPREVMQG